MPRSVPYKLDERQRETVIRNKALAYQEAFNYWSRFKTVTELDDVNQWALLGLIKAVHYYDPSRGKFSTFAVMVIRNEISKAVKTYNKLTRDEKMVAKGLKCLALSVMNDSPCASFEDEDLEQWFRKRFRSKSCTDKEALDNVMAGQALSVLDEIERTYFDYCFFQMMNSNEICREMGMSKLQQAEIEKEGLRKMREALRVEFETAER